MSLYFHLKRQYLPTRRQNTWMLCDNLKFYTDDFLWGVLCDEDPVATKLLTKHHQHIYSLQLNVQITTCFGFIRIYKLYKEKCIKLHELFKS